MNQKLVRRGETDMLNASPTTRLTVLAIAMLCAALPLERLSADEAPAAAGPPAPAA